MTVRNPAVQASTGTRALAQTEDAGAVPGHRPGTGTATASGIDMLRRVDMDPRIDMRLTDIDMR